MDKDMFIHNLTVYKIEVFIGLPPRGLLTSEPKT